jgi:hypothetical protein
VASTGSAGTSQLGPIIKTHLRSSGGMGFFMRPWLTHVRGELQSARRRGRFGVHRIGFGRIEVKVPVHHQVACARPNSGPVRNAIR